MKNLAIVLAFVFIALSICVYLGVWNGLPAIGLDGTHHVKHAILYAILAILSLLWFRFQTNAKT